MFRTLQATVNSTADSMAKELNKNFPLRRFMVVPDASATKGDNKRAEIVVIEGVPKNSKMLACSSLLHESPPGINSISDYDMYYIVSNLPFAVRARMFWNVIGRCDAKGISCDKLYVGIEALNSATGPVAVDEKVSSKRTDNYGTFSK
jgi:hypothetical protein